MRGTRPGIGILGLTAVLAFALFNLDRAAAQGKPAFRAGAYAMDITPHFPISMNGGMRDRSAKGSHDTLHARCLVLDDGKNRLAIVVVDSCMVPREVIDRGKEIASKATSIPTSHMLVSATHTHTAPTLTGVFQSDPDQKYQKFVAEKIAQGIKTAAERLAPARIGWGSGKNPDQVYNRRWFVKDKAILTNPFGTVSDRVRMNPPRASKGLDKPAGPIDPEVSILAVETPDGKPVALLANYSLHYVGRVPGSQVSADYFGEFARIMARRLKAGKDFVGIMSNGTSGDINNVNFRQPSQRQDPFVQIRVVANSVAETAMAAYKKIEFHNHVTLASAEAEIELGVRKGDEAALKRAQGILAKAGKRVLKGIGEVYARETVLLDQYPDTVKMKLQAHRVGKLGITAIPCEVFVEIGLELKQKSPLKLEFTIELANGYNGYLPTPEQHKLGGYETWRARSSYLEAGASPKVVATLLKLLRQVAK